MFIVYCRGISLCFFDADLHEIFFTTNGTKFTKFLVGEKIGCEKRVLRLRFGEINRVVEEVKR